MRYLLPTLLLASLLVLGLRHLPGPPSPLEGAALLALASPRDVVSGERYGTYGGLLLPEGTFEKRFRYCGPGGCRTQGWGTVSGPGEWWGFLGHVEAPEAGRYEAEFILYTRSVGGVQRAVARYPWTIDVD